MSIKKSQASKPFLAQLVSEVVYERGYRYLDRCGQTMLDLEDLGDGWIPGETSPSTGTLHQLHHNRTLAFNSQSMSLAQEESEDEEGFYEAASRAFAPIIVNLGIERFVRVGVRYKVLFASDSAEAAEDRLARLDLVRPSDAVTELFGRRIDDREFTLTRKPSGQGEGLRFEVRAVIRERGKVPAELMKVHPAKLPRGQREARQAKLKEYEQVRKDPRYAVSLDLDVFWEDPEELALPSRFEVSSRRCREFQSLLSSVR